MESPLSNNSKVNIIREFDSGIIIKLYHKELGVNVSRYLDNTRTVTLYECSESKYRFYYPFSSEGDSDFYKLLSTSAIEYYPGWKWENKIAINHISDNSKIIDIGCGDGTFLSKIKEERNADCYGVEFNPDAIQKAESKGVKIYNQEIGTVAANYPGNFDIATSFQVLEHISQVKEFLKNKIKLVKMGGLIIIGVPYNNPYLYKYDKYHILNLPPHHMGLWNDKSLLSLQNYFPIKVEKIYIEPLDNFAYYLFVQFRMADFYKVLYKLKLFRILFRVINYFFTPISRLIKGRNIVIVFKKI